ncbi:alpha/beta hydrolase [Congregibacter brevis]|uniref:Alpha/beta hydrolase n=1 Tax=Congregibacter brevis TaxID=3081201 RepID=A0ABZ0IAQ7_9GAMM|nr:alpha/beta hydrolase [Congregibacter sp. IMCC45268]
MRNVLIALLLFVFTVTTTLIVVSPKTTPKMPRSAAAPIAEILDIEVNGANQRILMRGQNRTNPILLHVHGGPGGPDQAILRSKGFDIEDLFTVVYWDQRGAGASYFADASTDDLSLEQIVEDGLAVSEYLLDRFDKDKLYLQGHSWGTLVATHMATERPKLFAAYFGIGQMADSRRAELLSYNFTVQQLTQAGDQKALHELESLGPPPYPSPEEWLRAVGIERTLMRPLEKPDGSIFMSMLDTYLTFTLYRGYSISDKLNALRGSEISIDKLWTDAINADLMTTHRRFEIPVYFFQGRYDQHTVTEVAKAYFDVIDAPQKEYFEFASSAHWPHVNEFERYRSILKRLSQ